MKPVMQNVLWQPDGIGNGNCFAACLASLLDLPLWMVPPFEQMFGRGDDFAKRRSEWLNQMFGLRLVRTNGHEIDKLPPFYIASGPSVRGVHHSVIYREGALEHDPHPAQSGIMDVEWTWHLAALEGTRAADA